MHSGPAYFASSSLYISRLARWRRWIVLFSSITTLPCALGLRIPVMAPAKMSIYPNCSLLPESVERSASTMTGFLGENVYRIRSAPSISLPVCSLVRAFTTALISFRHASTASAKCPASKRGLANSTTVGWRLSQKTSLKFSSCFSFFFTRLSYSALTSSRRFSRAGIWGVNLTCDCHRWEPCTG